MDLGEFQEATLNELIKAERTTYVFKTFAVTFVCPKDSTITCASPERVNIQDGELFVLCVNCNEVHSL